MKALVEKDILMKKQGKKMRKALHFFYVQLSFFYFVENGSKKLIFRKIPKALQEIISKEQQKQKIDRNPKIPEFF